MQSKPPVLIALTLAAVLIGTGALMGSPLARAEELPRPTGDAARGKQLFLAYKCYACHGYTAQTGVRRLVPMRWPEEAFIGFVRNSPIRDMPAYRDVPAEKLADVYAYLRSIPEDAPDVSTIPLLNDIRARAAAKR